MFQIKSFKKSFPSSVLHAALHEENANMTCQSDAAFMSCGKHPHDFAPDQLHLKTTQP